MKRAIKIGMIVAGLLWIYGLIYTLRLGFLCGRHPKSNCSEENQMTEEKDDDG